MSPLSRGVVGEAKQIEESNLFETQHDIKKLIEQLEGKDEGQT